MRSAITFKYDEEWLSFINWATIILLLFNPLVSDCLLSFLKENEFYEKVEKKKVIDGAKYAFKSMTILYLDEKSFINFFNLLNVDFSISEPIIATSLSASSDYFSAILKFLENDNLVLENYPEKKTN